MKCYSLEKEVQHEFQKQKKNELCKYAVIVFLLFKIVFTHIIYPGYVSPLSTPSSSLPHLPDPPLCDSL